MAADAAARVSTRRENSFRHAVHRAQAEDLFARGGEIFRRQPALEIAFTLRPFAVEHGEHDGIAIAALGDHMLTQDTLEDEAIAARRPARCGVVRVTLPLVS